MASETIAVAHLTGSIFLSFKTDHTMCDQKQKDATSSISITRNQVGKELGGHLDQPPAQWRLQNLKDGDPSHNQYLDGCRELYIPELEYISIQAKFQRENTPSIPAVHIQS